MVSPISVPFGGTGVQFPFRLTHELCQRRNAPETWGGCRNRGAALGSRCVLLFPYVLSRRIEHGLLAYGPSRVVAAVKAAEKKLFIKPGVS